MKEAENYIEAFRLYVEIIESLESKLRPKLLLQKKILYAALLDALSKSVHSEKPNTERFVDFIREYSGWTDCERISLPHLIRFLSLVPNPEFDAVRKFAKERISKWATSSSPHLDQDPHIEDVRMRWPLNQPNEGLAKTRLEKFRHANLLYAYRNNLVHEFRAAGYGIEFSDDAAPYYITFDELDDESRIRKTEWELVYPIDFFKRLASICIQNLEQHLKANGLNPITSYDVGTYWIKGLNLDEG